MFNDITTRYDMGDASLEIIIMLLVAFILGVILGYLLGKMGCKQIDEEVEEKKEAIEPSSSEVAKSGIVEDNNAYEIEQPVEKPEIVEEAPIEISDEWKPETLDAPTQGQPDDLKRIKGIGPVIEKTLNDLGIFYYQQIADLSDQNTVWLDDYIAFPGRIRRENWIDQAKVFAAEKQD